MHGSDRTGAKNADYMRGVNFGIAAARVASAILSPEGYVHARRCRASRRRRHTLGNRANCVRTDATARWRAGDIAFERLLHLPGQPPAAATAERCSFDLYMRPKQRNGAASCSGLIGGNTGQHWRNE
ncbi:hypothetical protein BZM27_34645 [Paraburkholderia steynii]|uniref:Uncharacterized protein n=1 Tax=Paraburkholderia steynii TaxID=1245441 RepID=A0A4R0X9N4_9BURK|nr:hypothetical protein BZM27_34645 [Paraburkholderia steynii]